MDSTAAAAAMSDAAVEYAEHHWQVFPLRGKVPAIPNAHPQGDPLCGKCKGECGRHGHGVHDATSDIVTVTRWWGGRYRRCNIGLRVPESMIVIDVDPRHGGDKTLAALEASFGAVARTLTTISGRGDGGVHLFYRRPPGILSAARLGPGIDLKTSTGYVVGAPSIHPDSGKPYHRIDRPVAAPPAWLIELLLPAKTGHTIAPTRPRSALSGGLSAPVLDVYNAKTSWADILAPHGWTCLDMVNPDGDGARWRHPNATSKWSATVRAGSRSRLYVYSPNTAFDVTESGGPRGYSRFDAYAMLNHGGDLTAAARAIA